MSKLTYDEMNEDASMLVVFLLWMDADNRTLPKTRPDIDRLVADFFAWVMQTQGKSIEYLAKSMMKRSGE